MIRNRTIRSMVLFVTAAAIAALVAAMPAHASPTNRELAAHHAKAEAVRWAFDQHRFALYGDTRTPLGYRFYGCHRAAPGRYVCGIAIGVGYGTTVFEHAVKVRVTFRRGHVAVRRVPRSATMSLGTVDGYTRFL